MGQTFDQVHLAKNFTGVTSPDMWPVNAVHYRVEQMSGECENAKTDKTLQICVVDLS